MKKQDLLTITTVALGTATLTVATLLARPLEAGGEANQPARTIEQPKLVINGVELSLKAAEDRVFKAGEEPVFELRAVNTLDAPVEAKVRIILSAMAPANPMSRVLPMPSVIWHDERLLTLGAKEAQNVTLTATTNLPTSRLITVALAEVDPNQKPKSIQMPGKREMATPFLALSHGPGIVALRFSTLAQEASPELVVTR